MRYLARWLEDRMYSTLNTPDRLACVQHLCTTVHTRTNDSLILRAYTVCTYTRVLAQHDFCLGWLEEI